MIIQLNGRAKDIKSTTTLEHLLTEFNLDRTTVIIEHNHSLLSENASLQRPLEDGDIIEIVRFVGGG